MKKLASTAIAKFKSSLLFYQALLKDQKTPRLSKILIGAAIAYALSPIDLIPDFIPVLGYVDDLIIVPSLLAIAILLIPKNQIKRIKNEINITSIWPSVVKKKLLLKIGDIK